MSDPVPAGATGDPLPAPASAPTGTAAGGRRSRRSIWIVAAVVIVLIVGGVGATFEGRSSETHCALNAEVGLFNVTSPGILLNLPHNSSASEFSMASNWTVSSGSVQFGALPTREPNSGFGGGAFNGYGLLISTTQPIFEVYSVHNVSSEGGKGAPCGQPYVAEAVQPGYCFGGTFVGYPIPDPDNDSVEPHVFNMSCDSIPSSAGITPGAYMWFDSAFPPPGTPGVQEATFNLCDWTTSLTDTVRGSVGLPIEFFVPHDGSTIEIHGFLSWESWLIGSGVGTLLGATAAYGLAHGWIWTVASIGEYSEPGLGLFPPGLLAFERHSC